MTEPSRREQIVQAALALLADTPLPTLSTRQIAAAVGLTQPALFRHFASREDLLLAVLAHAQRSIATEVGAAVEGEQASWDRIEAVARTLLAFVARHPGLPALLFGEADSPRLAQGLGRLVTLQHALVRELVRVGQARGELTAAVTPEAAATLFVGVVQGVVLQWRLQGRPDDLEDRLQGPLDALRAALHAPAPPSAPPPRQPGARHLDVRPLLAAGGEPLEAVLQAAAELAPGSLLAITAPFRPAPLLRLLAAAGHRVREHPLGGRDHVLVVLVDPGPDDELLDLRDLEPPEPLEQVLLAASALGPGEAVRAWVPRHPRMLLGHLRERRLTWEVADLPDGTALLHLSRPR